MAILSRAERGKAAYKLVNLYDLPVEIQEDAAIGGGEYGVKVVEESVNGPVRGPLYGYYMADEEKVLEAIALFGAEAPTDLDEDTAREAAKARVDADAKSLADAEDARISAIAKTDAKSASNRLK